MGFLILLAVACLTAGGARAQVAVHHRAPVRTASEHRAQAAVAHLERTWLDALNRADVDTIAGILADDFVRPAPQTGQFIGKADLLRYYRSHLAPLKGETKRVVDMTVTVYGNSAVARGQVVTRDAKGAIVSRLLFTDVFVKRPERWQAVSAQESAVPGH